METGNRKILGPKGEQVTEGWTKLHNSDQIKEDEIGWTCSTHARAEKCIPDFNRTNRKKETMWEA